MADVLRCPSCFLKVAPTDFQCPRCELLLEGHFDDPPPAQREVSIVRAIMEQPSGTVRRERPSPTAPGRSPPGNEVATRVLRIPAPLDQVVPRVVGSLSVNSLSLTPFEAFVVWSIDGKTRADVLLTVLDLEPVELQAVLFTLESRGFLALDPAAPKPARKASPPPPPPVTAPRIAAAAPKPAPKPVKPVPGLSSPAPVTPQKKRETVTDARVKVGEGVAKNRKILDALKQVKRNTSPTEARPKSDAPVNAVEDLAAEGVLQVAIRMEQDGRVEEAMRYLERAIGRSPDAGPLLNRLAVVLVRDRGDLAYAERLLRHALTKSPDHEVYKRNLVMVLAHAARGPIAKPRGR